MTYEHLAYLHLATVLPAFALGTALLFKKKGTPFHKMLGKVYLVLMATTGVITLTMPARVGPTLWGHLGFLHAFSFLTLYSVPAAYLAIRRGNIQAHRGNMVGLYVGGLLIAGSFAFFPGRMLHKWLFH